MLLMLYKIHLLTLNYKGLQVSLINKTELKCILRGISSK